MYILALTDAQLDQPADVARRKAPVFELQVPWCVLRNSSPLVIEAIYF